MVKIGLQPGQLPAALSGFKPQRQLGNFNALSVDVHTKQVVLQNLVADISVEQLLRCQLAQLVLQLGISLAQHIKRGDQKSA